eukprot:1157331-Pelagomonas_calceolata.AAC.9
MEHNLLKHKSSTGVVLAFAAGAVLGSKSLLAVLTCDFWPDVGRPVLLVLPNRDVMKTARMPNRGLDLEPSLLTAFLFS